MQMRINQSTLARVARRRLGQVAGAVIALCWHTRAWRNAGDHATLLSISGWGQEGKNPEAGIDSRLLSIWQQEPYNNARYSSLMIESLSSCVTNMHCITCGMLLTNDNQEGLVCAECRRHIYGPKTLRAKGGEVRLSA